MITKPKAKKFRIRRSDGFGNTPSASTGADTTNGDATGPQKSSAAPMGMVVASGAGPDQTRISGGTPGTSAQTGRPVGLGAMPGQPTARSGSIETPAQIAAGTDIDQIRQEGLTGRQLRMARRVAQKHGLAVTSDFDAVRQLRTRGIDPFERSTILELVGPSAEASAGFGIPDDGSEVGAPLGRIQLPQTIPQKGREVGPQIKGNTAESRASEILKIQRDIARRRRKAITLLFSRLAMFVLLPTFLAGYYFYVIATPMYTTKTEFVIQQAEATGGIGGLGGLFQGTGFATSQDSITVQSYLTSRSAMLRLDADHNFRDHFSNPDIDPIQRLAADAGSEDMFKVYSKRISLGYDPTEGILKMEVTATDPATSQRFAEALVAYAEEQVDQLTARLRDDQMQGALQSYQEAEQRRTDALAELLRIQTEVAVIDPIGETAAILAQISTLESERQRKVLELASLQSATRPNEGRVNAVKGEIGAFEQLIGELRDRMTGSNANGTTQAQKNTELRIAEENYQFQTVMVQQALAAMEAARLEANRQVRYLSLGVEPVAPDSPTYPRAFEDTAISFLIFSGIYLMLSLTTAILREQVSS